MPQIELYELADPFRPGALGMNEAQLTYTLGNQVETIGSDAVKQIHPLGKLPAARIDGKPLFESAAIATAIADLVPEQNLRPGRVLGAGFT